MANKIEWSPKAVQNLDNICEYIARDSQFYAGVFAKRINLIVKNIPQFPLSGRIVSEYKNKNLREKIYEGYRIVYRIKKPCVEIVAICHGSRLLKNLL